MERQDLYLCINRNRPATSVVEYSIALAQQLDANLIFYDEENLSSPYGTEFMTTGGINKHQSYLKKNLEESQRYFEALVQKYQEQWVHLSYRVESGIYNEQVVETLNQEVPILIIFPIHDEYNTFSNWLGSTETKLAEELISPVLFVPAAYKFKGWKKIIYLGDLSQEFISLPHSFKRLAKLSNAKIEAVKVTDNSQERIEDLVSAEQADVFAFTIQEDRSLWERWFSAPNFEKIISASSLPVLVY